MVIDEENNDIHQSNRVYARVEYAAESGWPKRAKMYGGLTSDPLEGRFWLYQHD